MEMSEGKKEITVEIDTSLYSVVEEYSASAGVSEKNVVNYLLSNLTIVSLVDN